MDKNEWRDLRHTYKGLLKSFQHTHEQELAEIKEALAVLKKHAELIRELERLEERANAEVPEDHVRCQAVHHGRLICDEIAPRSALPQGWVVSLVGDLCYCQKHTDHANLVNEPTTDSSLILHRPETVEDVTRRR